MSWKESAAIAITPMGEAKIKTILSIIRHDKNAAHALGTVVDSPNTKQLIYIVPFEWNISELAMEADVDSRHHHGFNPTTHGNPANFDPHLYKVLFSKAIVDDVAEGEEIISKARGQKPLLVVKVDLLNQRVTGMEKPPEQGKYGDIPVPLF